MRENVWSGKRKNEVFTLQIFCENWLILPDTQEILPIFFRHNSWSTNYLQNIFDWSLTINFVLIWRKGVVFILKVIYRRSLSRDIIRFYIHHHRVIKSIFRTENKESSIAISSIYYDHVPINSFFFSKVYPMIFIRFLEARDSDFNEQLQAMRN